MTHHILVRCISYFKDELNVKRALREKELTWIKYLVTAFPMGLNDQIKRLVKPQNRTSSKNLLCLATYPYPMG